MAIPKVTLRTIRRKHSKSYVLDYTSNGKRNRQAVGTNKRDAEILQAKLQTELAFGAVAGVGISKNKSIDLRSLIKEYLGSRKNIVREFIS